MPLYEYHCATCDERFEALVPSFRASAACPACASNAVEKQLSTFAMAAGANGSAPTMPSGGGCCGGGCGCAH